MSDHEEHVLVVREGHGANCSSVGSVIDTLFASAVAGGVLLAAIMAAMKSEEREQDPPPPPSPPPETE